jgi:hypothetical protein
MRADDFRKLLGRKLSLRYALRDDSGYSSTEAVGVLMEVKEDDRISVMDRRGKVHDVPIDLIEAAKVFPA